MHRCRVQQTIGDFCSKNVKNLRIRNFYYHLWIEHQQCIQISTDMPSIGLVVLEINLLHHSDNLEIILRPVAADKKH